MTYEETYTLAQDSTFQGRVSVACCHFATYITGEASDTPAHSTRYKWAIQTLQVPMSAVTQIMATVVNDPNVQSAGSAIADADLQTAVETAVNTLL